MDPLRKLIHDRLKQLGLTMSEASVKLGKNHAYLQQFLKRGIPQRLGEQERQALASMLGVTESELRGTSPSLSKRDYSRNDETSSRRAVQVTLSSNRHNMDRQGERDNLTQVGHAFGDHDLPVFGTAQSGVAGGAFILSNQAVNWVARPDPLERVRDSYGMIVTGHTMSPKIDNGATVLVNPHLPPKAGDTCVFRHTRDDGTVIAVIKELRRSTDENWYVRQLNPRKDLVLKRSEWPVCHVTIGLYFGR